MKDNENKLILEWIEKHQVWATEAQNIMVISINEFKEWLKTGVLSKENAELDNSQNAEEPTKEKEEEKERDKNYTYEEILYGLHWIRTKHVQELINLNGLLFAPKSPMTNINDSISSDIQNMANTLCKINEAIYQIEKEIILKKGVEDVKSRI